MSTDASSLISSWNQNGNAQDELCPVNLAQGPPIDPNRALSVVTVCVIIAVVPLYVLGLLLVYLVKRAKRQLRKKRGSINPEGSSSSLLPDQSDSGHVPSTARLFTTTTPSAQSEMQTTIQAPPNERRIISSADLTPSASTSIPCGKEAVFTHYASNNKDVIRLCMESKTPYRHVKFAFQFNDQEIHSLFHQTTDFPEDKPKDPPPDKDPNVEEKSSKKTLPEEPYDEGAMEQKRRTSAPEDSFYTTTFAEESEKSKEAPPEDPEPYDEGAMEQLRRNSDPEDPQFFTMSSASEEDSSRRSLPEDPLREGQMEQLRRSSEVPEVPEIFEAFSSETAEISRSSGPPEVPLQNQLLPKESDLHPEFNRIEPETMLLENAIMAIPSIFRRIRSVFTQTEKPKEVPTEVGTEVSEPFQSEGTFIDPPEVLGTGTGSETAEVLGAGMETAIFEVDVETFTEIQGGDVETETQPSQTETEEAGTLQDLQTHGTGTVTEPIQVTDGSSGARLVLAEAELQATKSSADATDPAQSEATSTEASSPESGSKLVEGVGVSSEASPGASPVENPVRFEPYLASTSRRSVPFEVLVDQGSEDFADQELRGPGLRNSTEDPALLLEQLPELADQNLEQLSRTAEGPSEIEEGYLAPPATAAQSEVLMKMPSAADSVLMLISSISSGEAEDGRASDRTLQNPTSGSSQFRETDQRDVLMEDQPPEEAENQLRSSFTRGFGSLASKMQKFQEKEDIFHDKNSGVLAHLAIRNASLDPGPRDVSESADLAYSYSSAPSVPDSGQLDSLKERAKDLVAKQDSFIDKTSEIIAELALDNAVNQICTNSSGTCPIPDPLDCSFCPTEKAGTSSKDAGSRKRKCTKDKSEPKNSKSENRKSIKKRKNQK